MNNVLEYLDEAVSRHPDKTAVADGRETVTYREFWQKVRRIGWFIAQTKEVRKPIAVFLDQSVCSLEAMMGIVCSGNFYAVLDTQMPLERIGRILKTLRPSAVLTDKEHLGQALDMEFDGRILLMEDAQKESANGKALEEIRGMANDEDILYVLFTSGSTGTPKGVVVTQRNVLAYTKWASEAFAMDQDIVFGNQTPFYFSMSVLDIYCTFKNGGTLVIIPKRLFSYPLHLTKYLREQSVNTIYWVPSALGVVSRWKALGPPGLPRLQRVLFAGEVMPVKCLNYWMKEQPKCLYANLYGPTEVTDICTYYIVNHRVQDGDPLPIGKTCRGCRTAVIDSQGKPVKPGEAGELYVQGAIVARGYYNNPEKTREAFVQNPLQSAYPETMYRTGDIVRENDKGELLYVGRKDQQIKHKGYRIELGEIEAAAGAVGEVQECACIYDGQRKKLVLFYQGNIPQTEFAQRLKKRLPDYMMPNRLVPLKKLPRNQNGKISRGVLQEML